MNKFLYYYNTIKYLKPVQIYGRLFSSFKKFLPSGLPSPPGSLSASLKPKTDFIFHDPWNCYEDLSMNKFCFLNHSIDFGRKINWKPDSDLLWQFNLHYFNYLYLLPEEVQTGICTDWIKKNPAGKEPGWHPYPLSLRITNWCKSNMQGEQINKSLYAQASFLFRNSEYYHPANHYLENARALIFSGLYFHEQGEASKWLAKGLEIISGELPKQVLPDGGYFEKSIMYHTLMAELILDILNVLPESNGLYERLLETARKMLQFLVALTHPGGKITLFNDSSEEIAPSTKQLTVYGGKLNITVKNEFESNEPAIYSFTNSGYFIFRNKDIYIAIDGGSIGPGFIPAHAHADIFTYELSVKDEKIIVDAGVYEYRKSPAREYSRSTKAHNTISIDGRNQAEVWDSFRTARRYPPENIKFERRGGRILFSGEFRGFSKLIGDNLMHKRSVIISSADNLITFEDTIEGKGNHRTENFIHLNPSVKISNAGGDLIISKNELRIKMILYDLDFRIEDGFYFPEFGKKMINKVVVLSSEKIPVLMKYSIQVLGIE